MFELREAQVLPKKNVGNVTDVNRWVDYVIDFSDQAIASHKKLVLFFNAGADPQPGDVYFINNIESGGRNGS